MTCTRFVIKKVFTNIRWKLLEDVTKIADGKDNTDILNLVELHEIHTP